jgi:hypothetical protein
MRRREFMAIAGGALVGVAGCTGTRSSGPGGTTPTDESTGTDDPATDRDEPTGAADVTVGNTHLQYGVVTPTSPDSIGVSNPETAYLVASVSVDGALARDEFRLETGTDSVVPTRLDRLYRTSWGDDQWYERDRTAGLVLFESPPAPSGDLRVTWPGGDYALDDSFGPRLEAPPRLSASFDLPSSHEGASAPPVTVEVTNEGETASRLLGALNRVGPRVAYTPVARVSELVPPGESTTVTVPDEWSGQAPEERVGDDDPDVTYHLDFAGGEDAAEVRLLESD